MSSHTIEKYEKYTVHQNLFPFSDFSFINLQRTSSINLQVHQMTKLNLKLRTMQ